MDTRGRSRRYLLTVFVVVLFVSGVGVAALAQPNEGDVYTGCLNQTSGVLRNVAVGFEPVKTCNEAEIEITWDRAGPAFDERLTALEGRVDELEEPYGTLDLFVDCDAGGTVGGALTDAETHLGPVNITISGVCEESVWLDRDDVSFVGTQASDGIRGPSDFFAVGLFDAHRVEFSNMTISGGNSGMLVWGSSFRASDVTIRDSLDSGIVAIHGSIGVIRDCAVSGHAGAGVTAGTESVVDIADSRISSNESGVGVVSATINLSNSEIVDNEIGADAHPGGNLRLSDTLVANNRFVGVQAIGIQLEMDGETRISGSEGHLGGLFVGTGSSVYIGTGPVVVEGNRGNGIQVSGGSAFRADELIVRNNGGNGIAVGDLSTVNLGDQIEILDNGAWGISCEGPPAVAVLGGQVDFDQAPVYSGNTEGDTNCQ